jgi:SAM-dependent methyltransferase
MTTMSTIRGRRDYWVQRYEEWWDKPFHGIAQVTDAFMEREEAGIRAKLPALLKPTHRVLDAGCGYGRVGPMIWPHVAEYVGVDFSPKAIEAASKVAPKNASFVAGDIVEYEGEPFDVIVMVGLDSSVQRRPEVHAHLRTLLKPKGVLAVFEYGDDRAMSKDGSTWPL